jgi:hypothetical protein
MIGMVGELPIVRSKDMTASVSREIETEESVFNVLVTTSPLR